MGSLVVFTSWWFHIKDKKYEILWTCCTLPSVLVIEFMLNILLNLIKEIWMYPQKHHLLCQQYYYSDSSCVLLLFDPASCTFRLDFIWCCQSLVINLVIFYQSGPSHEQKSCFKGLACSVHFTRCELDADRDC